ncbi:DUF6907 domain-containing protein [Streptomyces sp. NPDC059456]|uniref:DUF6907 domain-containing protein n=1 Tax=Streptomyces sp. NPDC059456 TaxID=3346838 RepID=UPI0036C0EF01
MTTVLPERPVVAEPGKVRTWLRRIWGGGQIVESCPSWCTDHHRNDSDGALVDLCHGRDFDAIMLPVFDAQEGTLEMPVLSARIVVDPYDDRQERRMPHVVLEPWQDEVMECLNPDQFAAVIAQVRAHCDELDKVHAALITARQEATSL